MARKIYDQNGYYMSGVRSIGQSDSSKRPPAPPADEPTWVEITGDDRDNFIIGKPTALSNTLHGKGGNDQLFGGLYDDVLDGGIGADKLVGGGGNDTASYSSAIVGVSADLSGARANTGEALGDTYIDIDNLLGSSFSDILDGDNQNNVLLGGSGNDQLAGGAGNDQLAGGEGDDILFGGAGADRMSGGSGQDTADYGQSTIGLTIDLTNSTNSTGDAAGDTFDGVETIVGTNNDDVIIGNIGDIKLVGGYGNDQLWGSAGYDLIIGDDGDDSLQGSFGDDALSGGSGEDFLDGGSGRDHLEGGSGADIFAVRLGDNAFDRTIRGADVIEDFRDELDHIALLHRGTFADLEFETALSPYSYVRGVLISDKNTGEAIVFVEYARVEQFTEADFISYYP